MTVKVLVTSLGQQLIAGVKQIENKDTSELVGYWLSQPRVVQYTQNEEGGVGVNFGSYCLISDENEFSIRAEHIVAILEPRDTVVEGYNKIVFPELEVNDGTDTADTEATTDDTSVTDGTDGDGTTGAPETTDDSVGEGEAVTDTVA
jgi:hypothetical protein